MKKVHRRTTLKPELKSSGFFYALKGNFGRNLNMEIYVGDERLQFELTETLPFSAVMQKLQAWAESQNLFIVDYRVAAKPGFESKEDLNSEEIAVINLQLGDQRELIESNLRELIDYTDRAGFHLAGVIQAGNALGAQEEQDLTTGGVFLAESLQTLQTYLRPDNPDSLARAVQELNSNPDLIEKINALALIQNQLKIWLRQTEFSRVSPEEAAERVARFRAQIPGIQEELEKIAARFTQGREQEALQLLETVSQTLVDAVVLMRIAKDKGSSAGEKLVDLLGQLTAAIDSRDLVTAADIVDFDLRDLLKAL
ncbi:MAG: hypothetical protein ACOY5B_13220 [Spirochaetota bacterium]